MKEEKKKTEENAPEKAQDSELERNEEKKKARLRTRGPYRKAHADW